jgi:hypothetical protein
MGGFSDLIFMLGKENVDVYPGFVIGRRISPNNSGHRRDFPRGRACREAQESPENQQAPKGKAGGGSHRNGSALGTPNPCTQIETVPGSGA